MGSIKPLYCPKCGKTEFTAQIVKWDDYTTRIALFCTECQKQNPKTPFAHRFLMYD